MKLFRIFLLFEAIILLATLSLQIWALKILAQSCSYARSNVFDGYQNVPFAQLYTRTETQTVTGYETTTTKPASISVQTTIVTEVALNCKTYTTTERFTGYYSAQPIAYSPTATTTRTIATTGMQDIRAGAPLHDTFYPPSYIYLAEPFKKNKRQNTNQSEGVSIFPTAVWSLDTSFDLNKYRTITINHGFAIHFVEAGIDYDYGNHQRGGYKQSDYARIAGLTTLMTLSILTILFRLYITTIRILSMYKQQKRESNKEEARYKKSRDKTFYANLAATILLIASCLAFWIIYGLWTHVSAEVKETYQAIKQQKNLVNLGIAGLFKVEPWKGVPIALITFSCLSCIISLLECILW